MKNSLKSKIDYYNELVNDKMQEYLSDSEIPSEMQKAMSYSVFAGGKRLRPALLLATCELFGGKKEKKWQSWAIKYTIFIVNTLAFPLPAPINIKRSPSVWNTASIC